MTTPKPSLLQSALHATKIERETISAREKAETDEQVALVAALHAAFAPYEDEVGALVIRNPYHDPNKKPTRTISELVATKAINPIKEPSGLSLQIWTYPSSKCITLRYESRSAKLGRPGPAVYLSDSESRYSEKPETTKTFDGFTPPEELLAQFFALLSKYVLTP